ncbi:MAG: hypothetical protein RIQ93_1764 [Verrucomicrobiota bacterium]|jgi:prepilin-type N-terminal cleavage/methylation domain-containing protein
MIMRAAPQSFGRGWASHPSRAFTIIELLVAAAITAVLAGIVIAMVGNVSTSLARTSGRLNATAQARLALDQLTLDLQSALFREDGNVWMAVDIVDTTNNAPGLWVLAQTAGNAKPAAAGGSLDLAASRAGLGVNGQFADTRYGMAGVWLRFFTSSRGANLAANPATISAPVAVGYQIVRRRPSANPQNAATAYLLHRAEVRPAADNGRPGVLESGYDITDAAYTTGNTTTNSGAITGDPRSIRVPGSATNLDSVIADNVIDFGVRCYVRDPASAGGLRLIFPANAGGAPAATAATRLRGALPSHASIAPADFNQLFPDVIDVLVRVLSDEGAKLIANMEKSPPVPASRPAQYATNGAWWWGVAEANSQVLTRRIVLNSRSL